MITSEEALKIVEKYLKDRNVKYIFIAPLDKVWYIEQEEINYPASKYYEQMRNIYSINYDIEGYQNPIAHFVHVDAETGEVLYTMTPHGYAEDWEED